MRRLANLALGVLLGGMAVVALAVAAVPAADGTKAVTIDAPSMQRVIPMGSLAYVRDEPSYEVGEIVTYRVNGHTVTHEIVEWLPRPSDGIPDGSLLQTKGTENADPDPYTITRDQVVGRVVAHVPWIGLVVRNLGSLPSQVFLVTLALGLYYVGKAPAQQAEPCFSAS